MQALLDLGRAVLCVDALAAVSVVVHAGAREPLVLVTCNALARAVG